MKNRKWYTKTSSVLKLFSVFIILPVFAAISVYLADQNGFFQVDQIKVVLVNVPDYPYYYSPMAEKLEGDLKKFKGQSLLKLKIKTVVSEISKKPWVLNLQVSKSWPGSLVIEVEPKNIVALYADGTSKLMPIDDSGALLDSIESTRAPDVVLLKGKIFEKDHSVRKKAVDMIKELPDTGYLSKKNVSDVRYSEKEGFWLSVVSNGIGVRIGHQEFNEKAKRVAKVLEYLENKNIQGRVIDADFSKKVLVKLRKQP